MGRYDLDWIIILFFIYLDAFRVEKLEESTCRVILVVGPNLENWGLKPSRAILRHKNDIFFWSKILLTHTLDYILHSDTFPMVQKPCINQSSYEKVMPPAS
jgi:hypothetical protein